MTKSPKEEVRDVSSQVVSGPTAKPSFKKNRGHRSVSIVVILAFVGIVFLAVLLWLTKGPTITSDQHIASAETSNESSLADAGVEPESPARVRTRLIPTVNSGSIISGELGAYPGELFDGRYRHPYYLHAQAGDRITVNLYSSEFDSYIILKGPDGVELMNDDGRAGWNSSITHTVPMNGHHSVVVTSSRRGATGSYTLSSRIVHRGREDFHTDEMVELDESLMIEQSEAEEQLESERQRMAEEKLEAERRREEELRRENENQREAERQRVAAQQREAERQRVAAQQREAERQRVAAQRRETAARPTAHTIGNASVDGEVNGARFSLIVRGGSVECRVPHKGIPEIECLL